MKRTGALFAFLILNVAAPMARADLIQWTLQNVKLIGTFGTVNVTGTFDTGGPGALTSNITAVEIQPNPVAGGPAIMYTYNFSGPLNGPDYNNFPSQQPPTPCIIAGCSGTTGPIPGFLNLNPIITGNPPGPYDIGASFEDNEEIYTGSGTIVGMASPTPEPSMWIPASTLMAIGCAGLFARRMRARS